MKDIALITGASSGMGRDFAVELTKGAYLNLDEIWLVARRQQRLEAIARKFKSIKFKIIPLDLTEPSQMERLQELLQQENPNIKVLVNSAGFGKAGSFTELDIDDQLKMIDLNIKALTKVTYECINYMDQDGKIIQIASSAGFIPQPYFSVYSATKAYVINFSRALNTELMDKGISVLSVCPGPVKTEFFKVATPNGLPKSFKFLFIADSKKVVRKAMKDAYKNKDISVYGFSIMLLRIISKIVPHRVISNVIGKMGKN